MRDTRTNKQYGHQIVTGRRKSLEGEPEFPVSPSNSLSFLLSPPLGRRWS